MAAIGAPHWAPRSLSSGVVEAPRTRHRVAPNLVLHLGGSGREDVARLPHGPAGTRDGPTRSPEVGRPPTLILWMRTRRSPHVLLTDVRLISRRWLRSSRQFRLRCHRWIVSRLFMRATVTEPRSGRSTVRLRVKIVRWTGRRKGWKILFSMALMPDFYICPQPASIGTGWTWFLSQPAAQLEYLGRWAIA